MYFVPPYSLEQVLSLKQKFVFLARLTGDRAAAGVFLSVPTNRGITGVNIHTQISIFCWRFKLRSSCFKKRSHSQSHIPVPHSHPLVVNFYTGDKEAMSVRSGEAAVILISWIPTWTEMLFFSSEMVLS